MHEVPRLMPTILEVFTNGAFKMFISASLLALDSNRVAQTSRVFKIGTERELIISVEARVLVKTNKELLKSIYQKLSDCPCLL